MYKISALTPATLSRLIPNDAKSTSSIAVVTLALIRFLLPFTSSIQQPDQPMPVISGTNSIVDVGGVGLSRFWGLRSHLQVASQVASANFPETVSPSESQVPKPSRELGPASLETDSTAPVHLVFRRLTECLWWELRPSSRLCSTGPRSGSIPEL